MAKVMPFNRATALVERVHGAHDESAMRLGAFRAAIADPLYRQIEQLLGDRLICTRPHRTLFAELTRVGRHEILKPQGFAERIRTHKEYVLETTVLKVGTYVHPDDAKVGDRIVVSQFAGSIWFDVENGRESELWLFASGDIILKLIAERAERTPLDDLIERYGAEATALA